MSEYGAAGSNTRLAEFGFFGFSRSEFLDFKTLPLEALMMVAHMVADDVVQASATEVGGPIQLAVVTDSSATILGEKDLQPIRDTASAFRMNQADYLVRNQDSGGESGDRGLLPR